MDLFLYRYRHATVLVVAILAQLALLAYQVRDGNDVRLLRVWAVGIVSPIARVLEAGRGGSANFADNYLLLWNANVENHRLKAELEAAQLENQRIRADLATAERAEVLAAFQRESPMKLLPARVFMNASGSASHVYVDVGSNQGIRNGMAVITAAGIVGKITSVYASASLMLLANDPSFAAGVISQKNRTQGTVRGTGDAAMVDFIANEQKLALDELFYTTGSDFLFPRGLKVGAVLSVKDGLRRKEVGLRLSGLEGGLEHVLIVVEGVHAPVPDAPAPPAEVTLLAPPADASIPLATAAQTGPPLTEADRVVEQHRGTVKNALPPTEIVKP